MLPDVRRWTALAALLITWPCSLIAQPDRAIQWLTRQQEAATSAFFVYRDHDDGRSVYPSGIFPTAGRLTIDTACVDDPNSPTGCTSDRTRVDCQSGTVLRLTWPAMAAAEFFGLNFDEPENYTARPRGVGFDLRPATHLVFRYRSPTGIRVQFGINSGRLAGSTAFIDIPQSFTWSERRIPIAELRPALPDLSDVHIPFFVVTNGVESPRGGTLLLDDIRLEPVPLRQSNIPAFPLGNRTCGIVPAPDRQNSRVEIPPDQTNRNLTTTYESALMAWALMKDGSSASLQSARRILDSFVAVHRADNSGLPLPKSRSGAAGLRSAYLNGQATFANDQTCPGSSDCPASATSGAKAGESRLAGFRIQSNLCGPSNFCLVLDGATGGNNAFAIISLLAGYRRFGDVRYLDTARSVATWIHEALLDDNPAGFGGYVVGYPDQGAKKDRQAGKSVENNADIAAAFFMMADIESELCNRVQAESWKRRSKVAGDFVMAMYSSAEGRFNAGTAPVGTAGPGFTLDGERRGSEVVNTFDFLDANTFVPLAMLSLPWYRDAIDWRRPLDWALRQTVKVNSGSREFQGFSLVSRPTAGPSGVAWEFTSQMVATMRAVDALYGEQRYSTRIESTLGEIRRAQSMAPFAENGGVPATTMENGDRIPAYESCLSTPFQCIAQRAGIAATAWAVFAEKGWNPLGRDAIAFGSVPRFVNAASFDGCLAPGGLVSLFRERLSATEQIVSSFPLPTTFAATRLEIEGRSVPLLYGNSVQLNAQVPYEASTGSRRIDLTGADGARTSHVIEMRSNAPGIFQLDQVRCLALRPDNTIVRDGSPLKAGDVFTVYMTGLGSVTPPVATGASAPTTPLSSVQSASTFTVGGQTANASYFGLTPGTAGVAQANLTIPAGVPNGHLELISTVGSVPSNACWLPVSDGVSRPAPELASLTPSNGPEAGGTSISVRGENFVVGARIRIGDQVSFPATFVSASEVRFTAPGGKGVVLINVVNPDGKTAPRGLPYTYTSPAPLITGLEPSSGPSSGGTACIILGDNFATGAAVLFGTSADTDVIVDSRNRIRVTSPPGSGFVNLTLRNPDGQSATSALYFSYISPGPPLLNARISGCSISGSIANVARVDDYRIVVWAFTNRYYIQPCTTDKVSPIRPDGSFGPIPSFPGTIYVQLVRGTFTPQDVMDELPTLDGVNVLASSGPIGQAGQSCSHSCPLQR